MCVRMALARLPSILNFKLVHKCDDLKIFLLHGLGKLSYSMSHFSNLFINGGSLRHHGAIAIVRKEFSEKIDEVTSRGDPLEEPTYKGVLDPASDAE